MYRYPRAVLYRASEIPWLSLDAASPPPLSPRAANERIIPITVPSSPSRVATEAIVERNTRFFSSMGSSSAVASSTSFCMASTFCSVSSSLFCDHFFVFAQTGFHYISHTSFLTIAFCNGAVNIFISQVILHFADEFIDISTPGSFDDCQKSFNYKSNTVSRQPIKIGTMIPPRYIRESAVLAPSWLGQKPPLRSGLVKLLRITDQKSPDYKIQ